MRSWRVLLEQLSVDDVFVAIDYADVFVVVREGAGLPADTDWEINLTSSEQLHLQPGRHALHVKSADGHVLLGDAVTRFSDGHRHLLRGDGPLDGIDRLLE